MNTSSQTVPSSSQAPTRDKPSVKAVLNSAADWLAQHRWVQRRGYILGPGGEILGGCMLGAIWRFTDSHGSELERGARAAVEATLGLTPSPARETLAIAKWNDAPGRRKREVIAALRAAAEQADGPAEGQDGQLRDAPK